MSQPLRELRRNVRQVRELLEGVRAFGDALEPELAPAPAVIDLVEVSPGVFARRVPKAAPARVQNPLPAAAELQALSRELRALGESWRKR